MTVTATDLHTDLHLQLRIAGRALARAGLVDAFGHCSARLDPATFLVTPSVPLASLAPGAAMVTVAIGGPLPPEVAPEVRLHQHVYRRRPGANAVCRSTPPLVTALSTTRSTPRARHGSGAWFTPRAPLWDDPLLIRDDPRAAAVADTLGDGRAVVLRGNGALTVGHDLREALVLAWLLEDAARVELIAMGAGQGAVELTPDEARQRATWSGGLLERAWAYLTAGDPEVT